MTGSSKTKKVSYLYASPTFLRPRMRQSGRIMNKRKFKRGERITSVSGARKAYKAGRWIYLDGQLLHPNSYSEISFGSIEASIKANRAYLAELVEEDHEEA